MPAIGDQREIGSPVAGVESDGENPNPNDFELDKIKIKKSVEKMNEKKRLANRARNNKVNTSQMGGLKKDNNSRNGSQNPGGSQNMSANKDKKTKSFNPDQSKK